MNKLKTRLLLAALLTAFAGAAAAADLCGRHPYNDCPAGCYTGPSGCSGDVCTADIGCRSPSPDGAPHPELLGGTSFGGGGVAGRPFGSIGVASNTIGVPPRAVETVPPSAGIIPRAVVPMRAGLRSDPEPVRWTARDAALLALIPLLLFAAWRARRGR